MLDLFDPSKIFIVGVVALIVIGPKELPRVMRTVGQVVGRMRRMAAEFQQQFNEAMREAELEDVRKELAAMNDAAKVDVSTEIDGVAKELTAVTEAAKADVAFDPATLTQHDNVKRLESERETDAFETLPASAPNAARPEGGNGLAAAPVEIRQTPPAGAKAPAEEPVARAQLADDMVGESGAP